MSRPARCCGVCPPIYGGGYDCTCRLNPRCPSLSWWEWLILAVMQGPVKILRRRQ